MPAWEDFAQHGGIKRHLPQIGRVGILNAVGRRAIGLEVHHQHLIRQYHQPVDSARDAQTGRQGISSAGDRDFGTGAIAEYLGKTGIFQDRQGGGGHLVTLLIGEVGLAPQQRAGPGGAFRRRQVREQLQQPMDQVTAPEPAQSASCCQR